MCRDIYRRASSKMGVLFCIIYTITNSISNLKKSVQLIVTYPTEYHMDETCQRTVPEAIIAFLESKDFEDAVRNAVSLGGDTDTLGAITGSIAEAFYGIPAVLIAECKSR